MGALLSKLRAALTAAESDADGAKGALQASTSDPEALAGSLRGAPRKVVLDAVYTSPLQAVNPPTVELTNELWSITPSDSLFLNLSEQSASIDAFISHVWFDEAVVREKGGPGRGDTFFFSMKSTGVLKAAQQLEGRGLPGVKGRPCSEWRFWVDHTCVMQSSQEHKIHTITRFRDLIAQSRSLIVLLSPTYFERLWCMFEMACFLAIKEANQVACYCWAFMDGSKELIQTYVRGIRTLSVTTSKCMVESDRALLRSQVAEYFKSEEAFARFAKFSGIAMIVQSLFLSPAVFSPDRFEYFVSPFLVLAEELGFVDLRAALESFDALAEYQQHLSGSESRSAETNEAYRAALLAHVAKKVMPLLRAESAVALRSPAR